MKYMLLIMGFREGEDMPKPPSSGAPSAEEFMAYQQELGQAGVLVDSGLLDSFEDATQVQVNDSGERLVTNGPFAESREYLGGYQILDVPDLDAALDWAARCPGAKYGRVEVRPDQHLRGQIFGQRAVAGQYRGEPQHPRQPIGREFLEGHHTSTVGVPLLTCHERP